MSACLRVKKTHTHKQPYTQTVSVCLLSENAVCLIAFCVVLWVLYCVHYITHSIDTLYTDTLTHFVSVNPLSSVAVVKL